MLNIWSEFRLNTMHTTEMRMQTVQSNTQFHAASILVPRCSSFVVVVVVFNVMMYTVVLYVFLLSSCSEDAA